MTTKAEKAIAALQQNNIETAARLAQLSMEHAHQIAQLRNQATQGMFEEGLCSARTLTEAKTPHEMIDAHASYAQQSTEKMLDCAQQIALAASSMQVEFAKNLSQHMERSQHYMLEAIDDWLKGMPLNNHMAAETLTHSLEVARKTLKHAANASEELFSNIAQASAKSKDSGKKTGASAKK